MASLPDKQLKSSSANGQADPIQDIEADALTKDSHKANEAVEEEKETASRVTTPDVQPPAQETTLPKAPPGPPGPVDHGLICWLQVVGAFALWANCWGFVSAYGIFQTYYQADFLRDNSPSQISWIGSIQAFLLLFAGPLFGPFYDAGYFRHLCIGGNLLVVFGMMMTSICKAYYQVVLAQGVVCGLGFGTLFLISSAIVPQYFVKKRALAMALASTGSGFGGVIYPIVFNRLQPRVGFGWATRVLGFIALVMGLISVLTMRKKLPPGKVRKLYDPNYFRNIPMLWLAGGSLFAMMGFFIPIFYVGSYSLELGITSPTLAFCLLPILQGAGLVGRILPVSLDYIPWPDGMLTIHLAFFADKTGTLNMLIPTSACAGVLALCWIAIENEAGLIVFAVLYGSFNGLILSLLPPSIPALATDMKILGTTIGMGFMLASFGVLIGTPISGAILRNSGHFYGLQAFGGCTMLASALLLAGARVSKKGFGMAKI